MTTFTCNYCGARSNGDERQWLELRRRQRFQEWHFCTAECLRAYYNYHAGVEMEKPVIEGEV